MPGMRAKMRMTTSNSNLALAWRISRYLFVRLCVNLARFSRWLLVRSVQFVFGFLALMASPASSGRAPDEFKDLVQRDSPPGQQPAHANDDGFWRMYLQAYSPRLWRMRRLLTLSPGKSSKDKAGDDGGKHS